jgi:hypothetical protein
VFNHALFISTIQNNNPFTLSGFILVAPFAIILSSLRDSMLLTHCYNPIIPSGLKKNAEGMKGL